MNTGSGGECVESESCGRTGQSGRGHTVHSLTSYTVTEDRILLGDRSKKRREGGKIKRSHDEVKLEIDGWRLLVPRFIHQHLLLSPLLSCTPVASQSIASVSACDRRPASPADSYITAPRAAGMPHTIELSYSTGFFSHGTQNREEFF